MPKGSQRSWAWCTECNSFFWAGVNDERLVDFGRVGLGADVALEVVGVTVDRPPVELPAPTMAE